MKVYLRNADVCPEAAHFFFFVRATLLNFLRHM